MKPVSRLGDSMECGDPIVQGSQNVFVNGIPIARVGDQTGGHASWVPNAMAEGSSTVFANNIPICRVGDRHIGHASPSPSPFHQTPLVTGSPNVTSGD
jgi:uncharacterized Zn-binding protein involved in type VI secretion